jgi:hypothetical protein
VDPHGVEDLRLCVLRSYRDRKLSTSTNLTAALELAHEWLRATFIRTDSVVGWGHTAEEAEPSEWGGTLDGVRGLLALGEPPLSPIISEAVAWLKKQQRSDGGFGARELKYSAAEATAWVAITLARLGLRADNDAVVRDAVLYLNQCLDTSGGAATTPGDVENPRALPTALTLWALAPQPGAEQVCSKIVTRLHRMQDSETGGWGVRFGAAPNAATTAQVLHALVQAGVIQDLDWVTAGVDYLISCQESDGSWRNSHDEWFTRSMPRTPVRCANFGTGWAVLALAGFRGTAPSLAARRGATRLIDTQRKNGGWLFEDFDPTESVWCTSQVTCALVEWHDRSQPVQSAEIEGSPSAGVALVIGWIRSSFVYLAIAALAVGELHGVIHTAIVHLSSSVRLGAGAIWVNIMSSAVWACLVVFGGLAMRRMHRGRRSSRQ